jgi:hypothetical protein
VWRPNELRYDQGELRNWSWIFRAPTAEGMDCLVRREIHGFGNTIHQRRPITQPARM